MQCWYIPCLESWWGPWADGGQSWFQRQGFVAHGWLSPSAFPCTCTLHSIWTQSQTRHGTGSDSPSHCWTEYSVLSFRWMAQEEPSLSLLALSSSMWTCCLFFHACSLLPQGLETTRLFLILFFLLLLFLVKNPFCIWGPYALLVFQKVHAWFPINIF